MCLHVILYFQAATDGDAEILQELIFKFGQVSVSHDGLINMYNALGYTMLHYAVMYKQLNCITTLIELGAGNKLSKYLLTYLTVKLALNLSIYIYSYISMYLSIYLSYIYLSTYIHAYLLLYILYNTECI